MITLNEYQTKASGTAIYPGRLSPAGMMYAVLKLNGEAGELAGHLCDQAQAGPITNKRGVQLFTQNIVKEIGDCAWYCAAIADELGMSLADIYGAELTIALEEPPFDINFYALKLNHVAGVVAEMVGKAMRDDGYGMPFGYIPGTLRVGDTGNGTMPQIGFKPERREKVIAGVKEVLDTIAILCNGLELPLSTALSINLAKLADRKARGVLSGSGDNR